MSTRQRLTGAQVAGLRQMILAGTSYAEIADIYGVAKTTVGWHATQIGASRYNTEAGRARAATESAAARTAEQDAMAALQGLMQDQAWFADAACAQIGGDEWFPEKGGSTREAKSVCNGDGTDARPACPVRDKCLAWALVNDERFGIFGGHSERERRKIKKTPGAVEELVLAATGTDSPVAVVEERPTPRQYGGAYIGGATGGHYPLPNPNRFVKIEGRGNAKPSIDWGTPANPTAVKSELRCRWCRTPTAADDLVDELCAGCAADAAAKFTAPAPVPDLEVEHDEHDDTPPPEESPTTPPTPAPDAEDDPMAHYPDYIRQMADIMATTENHPDPTVRAARKQVANAFVALDKTLRSTAVVEATAHRETLDAELAKVEKRGGKPGKRGGARPRTDKVRQHAGDGVKKAAARLTDLGVTPAQVRTWAREHGHKVPSRGAVPGHIVDAFEHAHQAKAVAS